MLRASSKGVRYRLFSVFSVASALKKNSLPFHRATPVSHFDFPFHLLRARTNLLDSLQHVPMLKPGSKAPAFRLLADDGTPVALKDFKGQRVLLFFYPKANTSG